MNVLLTKYNQSQSQREHEQGLLQVMLDNQHMLVKTKKWFGSFNPLIHCLSQLICVYVYPPVKWCYFLV